MKSQISILALLLLISACGNGETEENSENQTIRHTPVYVQELRPATFRHYVNIQGNVESDKTIMIAPKVSATVEEILVHAGDKVTKGDVLARLDGEISRNQLKQVQTQLELSKTVFERQQNLREQNIGSEIEFLQAKTQYESTQTQLATLTEQYENYTIRATISGTVNQVNIKVGESVGPASGAFQLANSEALKVTAAVSEAYIMRIEQTDSVEITFPSLEEQSITKKLDVVSKVINPSNRTFGVEIYIPNLGEQIRPNMMAKLKINDITLHDKIVIPANSVQKANNKNYVFVAEKTGDEWVASNREVTLSYNYNNDLVIEKGLQPGELLITAGYSDLSDGTPISIQQN